MARRRRPASCCLFVALQLAWYQVSLAGLSSTANFGGSVPVARPHPSEHARVARWLVHSVNWGTVSTQSSILAGFPYGNAVAISDGPRDRSTGRIFFYLTDFDQTATDLAANPKATLSICEAQMPDECTNLDPEDPRCAKVTLAGEILKVPDAEVGVAKELMFRRHRQMKDWHVHKFTFYELHIGSVRLLDYYGGYTEIKPDDYFAAWMVLEELKSDPCSKFPHRFYCVEDRWDIKKEEIKKRALADRRPDPSNGLPSSGCTELGCPLPLD